VLLDSTFVNDLIREEEAAVERLDDLIEAKTPVAISSLTVFEVGVGLRGPGERYRERFQRVVDGLEEVPFGPPEARRALKLQRDLYDRGEAIGAVDALIAGTAAEQSDARVLTRNVDEFERVDAIAVETY
jgi:predicted nucleic acid-binding protein